LSDGCRHSPSRTCTGRSSSSRRASPSCTPRSTNAASCWLDGDASEAEAPEPAPEEAPPPDRPAVSADRPTRADALLRLLAEDPDRTWKLSDLRVELVARGWLEDTREASASLQVTASKLTRAGRIARPGAGRYRAAEPGEAAA
jgi:hypothetical protein